MATKTEHTQQSKLLSSKGAVVKVVSVALPLKTQQQIARSLALGKRAADTRK